MNLGPLRNLHALPAALVLAFSLAACFPPAAAAANSVEDQQYYQAVQLFNQKNWDQARAAFQKFQAGFPRSRWQYAVKLRLADLETDPARAQKAFAEIMREAEGTEWAQDARWALANHFYSLGKYAKAIDQFLAVAQAGDPRSDRALYLAGLSQLALQQHQAARVLFTRVIEQFGKGAWVGPSWVGLGDTEVSAHNPQDALQAYDHYLKDFPQGEMKNYVLEQKSKILEQLGLHQEASETSRKSGATPPAPAAGVQAAGPERTAPGHYTVQVGAFTRPEYALALMKKLRKKGYNAYQIDGRSGTEVFHQVRVGNYADHDLARKIAMKLENQEKLPTLVTPYVAPDTKP